MEYGLIAGLIAFVLMGSFRILSFLIEIKFSQIFITTAPVIDELYNIH